VSTRVSAGFDALTITDRLERTEGGAAAAELHAFAYLACLMAFYDHRQPDAWAYGFSATPAGAPYAAALAEECDRLRAAGRLLDRYEVLVLSEQGRGDLQGMRALRSCAMRERYLEASCAAATLLPLPAISDALSFEPQLQRALKAPATRELLKPVGLALVNQQFRALADALRQRSPNSSDLLVPTTVWLTYLTESGRSPGDAG
jgi:hypothetical protein